MNRRPGFTFVEMMICVVIIGLIAVAIGGFSMAVSSHWKQTNQQQILQNTGAKSQATVGSVIETAKAFGIVSDTTRTQMILWYSDSFNGAADGVAQLAELAVVEFDSTRKSIMLYRTDLSQTYDVYTSANYVAQASDLTNGNVADYIKAQSWIMAGRPILGPGASSTDTSVTQVSDASFNAFAGSARSGVEAAVVITRDGTSSVFQNLYGQRAAMTPGATPAGSTAVSTVVAPATTASTTGSVSAATLSSTVNTTVTSSSGAKVSSTAR